jgi:hypothetical protein
VLLLGVWPRVMFTVETLMLFLIAGVAIFVLGMSVCELRPSSKRMASFYYAS